MTCQSDFELSQKLSQFFKALKENNSLYGLYSKSLPEEQLMDKLQESVSTTKYLSIRSDDIIADLGSGNGMLGMPVSFHNPEAKILLVDSSQKKTNFLKLFKRQYNYDNIEVITSRIEDWETFRHGDGAVCMAIAQALSSLSNLYRYFSKVLGGGFGWGVAYKTENVFIDEIPPANIYDKTKMRIDLIIDYTVSGKKKRRSILFVKREVGSV